MVIVMSDSKTCILVAGAGGGGTGMELIKAFSLGSHEYKIVATDINENSFGLFETPHRYIIPHASSENYINSLLKICKKENVQAIATGSEPELKMVSKNSQLFEEIGVKVLLNPWKIIELCTDKFKLMELLREKNIHTPKSFLYEKNSDLSMIESLPVVIKPSIGGGSQYVFLAQDMNEADFFCNYLIKYGYQPLVQEYVGSHEEEFTIGILYADKGRLCSSIAMKRILGSGLSTRQIITNKKSSKKYMISSGISQGIIDDFAEIREMAENIASILDTNGPINIQCRKNDSELIPFEINPRFSGTTGPRSIVGYNEPEIFCRYRLFDEIPKSIQYKHGYVVRSLVEKYISFDEAKDVIRI